MQVTTSSAAYQAPRAALKRFGFARLPIGEGGVDEIRIRNAVNELAAADPLGSSPLRQQALAGRPFDFGERGGVLG